MPYAQYSAEKLKSDMQMTKKVHNIKKKQREKRETKAIWRCQFSLCTTLWESFWTLVWRSFIRNQFSSV